MPSTTSSKCNVLASNLSPHSSRAAFLARHSSERWLLLPVLVWLFFFSACAHVNNPYKDSGAAINDEMNTASVNAYQADRAEFGRQSRRSWQPASATMENGAVSHWPQYFEDPFEDKGNTDQPTANRDAPDNQFALNWVDYFHIAYGPARMILNAGGFPISAVLTHPGMLMESNGRIDHNILGYDHDAKKSDSVVREPPDVNVIRKSPPSTRTEPLADEPTMTQQG